MISKMKVWLLAHPALEHFLEGGIMAVALAAYHYISTGTETGIHMTWQGLLMAVAVAGKLYFASNRATLIAWAQDFLEKQAPATPSSPTAPVSSGVAQPSNGALTPLKMILFIIGLSLLASSAMATPLSLFTPINASPTGEDDFILAPIGSVEFNPSTPSNYGLAFSESIGYARVTGQPDGKHVLVSPYAFVGIFLAADIGQWVNSTANSPILLDYGFMVGLPKLDDTLPEVAFSYDFRTNQFLINAAFPVDLLPSILVHKL